MEWMFKRTIGRLKTWATTFKESIESLAGPGTVEVSRELARDRRAWGASARDVVNSIGDVNSTHQVSRHEASLRCQPRHYQQALEYELLRLVKEQSTHVNGKFTWKHVLLDQPQVARV